LHATLRHMVVSVPEKTLEHWASIYLTYRYRSKASLWWPARGEDIYIGSLPSVPGKTVQLELKTTTLNRKGDVHRVKIDLVQLDHYLALPHWLQPFYVFPMPRWTDTLESATAAIGLAASEVGFSRVDSFSIKPWWFADWMVALTASQVGQILITEMAAFKVGGTRDADLVTTSFKGGRRSRPVWADRLQHRTIPWRTLWTRLEVCGAASWPQAVMLPASIGAGRTSVHHADIRSLLADAGGDHDGDLLVWGSTGDGTFEPAMNAEGLADRPAGYDATWTDWRIGVGMSLEALSLT
jgi:hypothetical protein